MAEQVQNLHQSITFPTLYYSSTNPFTKTIEVCGSRRCFKCAGTRNENFMISDEPSVCSTCKGTGKETYYETRDNPYFGKTEDELDRIISQYRYKESVGNICRRLNSKEEMSKEDIKTWKGVIKCYETLGGDSPLIQIAKAHILRLKSVNIVKNYYTRVEKIKSLPELQTEEIIAKCKREETMLSQKYENSIPSIKKRYLEPSLNLLNEIESSCIKKAIDIPVESLPFVTPPQSVNTFSHIPDLSKPQGPVLTIKPVKWNEWTTLVSDNGGFVDIMDRHSAMCDQLLAEQEKIRWMKRFIVEYRKYAVHCKSQGVKPDPIPNVDILNRRLQFVTLDDGERIYNTHYNPPGCVII